MHFATLPIILSFLLLCGFGSCQQKPDAFICTFIVKNPIEHSYSFCVNYKTKEERSVPVQEMAKWITTDPDSYETTRDWYKKACAKK